MNSNLTSKIVVGLGLAAAFGTGVSIFAVHAKQQQESQFALNAPAPAVADPNSQNATDATVPAQSAATQASTDQTATPSSAPPAAASTALANLLAWRLDIAHVDPLSTLTWVSGGNARFASGVPVMLLRFLRCGEVRQRRSGGRGNARRRPQSQGIRGTRGR